MHWLIIVLMGAAGNLALADFEITCNQQDCLAHGWQVTDLETGSSSEVACLRGDCRANGWIQVQGNKTLTEVQCLREGCFNGGFDVLHPSTGRVQTRVRCRNHGNKVPENCMDYGWNTFRADGTLLSSTRCSQSDCRTQGWRTDHVNGNVQLSTCKEQGCFQSGWTITP